jgi:hypothetical protein
MEWEKLRKAMQLVTDKNSRNLETAFANWNLNEVLRQELFFLCLMMDSDELLKRTSLSHEIPLLYTSGRDLSLILETLFRAVYRSIPKAGKKDMSVVSRMENGEALVQIQAPTSKDFEYHLTKVIDPTVLKEQADEIHRGMNVLNQISKPLHFKLEVDYPGTGVLVRLMIPLETVSTSSPRGEEKASGAKGGGNKQVIV